MNITGRIVEMGALEDGSCDIGFVIRRPNNSYVSVIGLTEDETRAIAPFFMNNVTITVMGTA